MPKKRSETAPPAAITLTCPGRDGEPCGRKFDWVPRGGRRRKYCDEHRRGRNVERSELAYQARKELREDVLEGARSARQFGRLSRLAAGLRVFRDPHLAAAFAGVSGSDAELEALAADARKHFPDVVKGEMKATMADAAIHLVLSDLVERRAEIPARDLPRVGQFALTAREELMGEGPRHNYTALNFSLVPPPADGKLTPEQLAKMKGEDPE